MDQATGRWIVVLFGTMAFTAVLTMGATYHGWCLGRQATEQRVIVPAPSVTVDPAQIRVEVAPTTVRVEPPQVRVETPHTTVRVEHPAPVEPKSEPAPSVLKTTPVNPIVITPAIPHRPGDVEIKDVDEYGELLPPPKERK